MVQIFKKPEKQVERKTVEFLEPKEIKLIVSPLTDKAFDAVDSLIDRYVDAKMKDLIVNKINETPYDENAEIKLKWVLEFKKFLDSIR